METAAEVATTVSDKVKITALFHLENISSVPQTFCGSFQNCSVFASFPGGKWPRFTVTRNNRIIISFHFWAYTTYKCIHCIQVNTPTISFMFLCMHTHTYMHMCTLTHMHECAHTHTHTQAHTHTHKLCLSLSHLSVTDPHTHTVFSVSSQVLQVHTPVPNFAECYTVFLVNILTREQYSLRYKNTLSTISSETLQNLSL